MSVSIGRVGTDIRIVVEDDGAGSATIEPGGGLAGLRDRVEALGGTLEVRSEPGAGTCLVATLPGDEAREPGSR